MGALFATIQELRTYPLKSGKGHSHKTIEITPRGLKGDRVYVLVQDEGAMKPGHHFSQREANLVHKNAPNPMVFIETILDTEAFYRGPEKTAAFRAPEMPELTINPNPNFASNPDRRTIYIHGNPVDGLDCGAEAAAWFSTYLQYPVRLMRFPEDHVRQLDTTYFQVGDHTAYADGSEALVTSTASLAAIQPHIQGPAVDMNQFRPNIVVDGPFPEDKTRFVRFGDAVFELTKPCARCVIPTIDQETGLKHPNAEPTLTLGAKRKGYGDDGLKGVFFGQNAAPRLISQGMQLRVGDRVEIIQEYEHVHSALAKCVVPFTI